MAASIASRGRRAIAALVAALMLACVSAATIEAVPTAPGGLVAQVAGSTVTLTWRAASGVGVTGYRIEAGSGPGLANVASSVIGPATTFTAVGVPAGTYFVRVRATAFDGESGPSNEVVVLVGGGCATPPNPPAGLTSSVSGTLLSLNWMPGGGCPATNYALHAGSSSGLSNLAIVNAGTALGLVATAPAGTYYLRVFAQNPFGSSRASNELIVSMGGTSPTPTPTPTPSPSPCDVRALQYNTPVNSILDASDCDAPHRPGLKGELFTFDGVAGRRVNILMQTSRPQPYLVLVGPNGAVAVEGAYGAFGQSSLWYTLSESGQYTIEATLAHTSSSSFFPITYSIHLR